MKKTTSTVCQSLLALVMSFIALIGVGCLVSILEGSHTGVALLMLAVCIPAFAAGLWGRSALIKAVEESEVNEAGPEQE